MIMKKEKDFNKIKLKEREKGITLIALVITIIVLLILAAVSIAMLTGENGILKKASTAKEKHQISEAKEKIELALQDLRIEEESKGNSLTKEKLYKLSESEYEISVESTESFPVEVVQSIYKFQINDKYQVEYLGEATGTIVTYKTEPEGYTNQDKVIIKLTVKNSKGIKEIQCPDGTHIFLITGDYVDLSVANRLNSNTGMTKQGSKYRVNWSSAPSSLQTVEDTVKTRFMTTGYTLNSSNPSSRCVSTLLNASNWENYKDNNGMAEYAIGGSTIEMWMDSWNKRYPNDKLYCNNTNADGYYVGTSSSPSDYNISSSVMRAKDGYNNSLYYPHHEKVSDGDKGCYSYLLASPSATGSHYALGVAYTGQVSTETCDDTELNLRPVVSLNSGIKVNATDAE